MKNLLTGVGLIVIGSWIYGAIPAKEAYTVPTVQEYAAAKLAKEEKAKEDRQSRRIDMCEEMARNNARHPSTFSFSRWNVEYNEYTNGNALVTTTVSAKNSFGLEINSQISCSFKDGKISLKWQEAGR